MTDKGSIGFVATLLAVVVLVTGCAAPSAETGSVAIVASSTPQRVVLKVVNNACGEAEDDTESLTTGSVKGLKKVLNGFGIPYDEHADAFTRNPQPITDDSEGANKERGIGYMGLEAHMPQQLAPGQTHSPDHPEASNEPGTTFSNLTTEEEKYGIAMRWEYYNPDLSGPAVSGYSSFMGVGSKEGKQYVAVHNLKTDKWCICCPYDWGPALNLPTTGGGKYAHGRIGGVTPQAAEDLGITGGDCNENSMTECWWVENSSQVKCGPINDLSSLTGTQSNKNKENAKIVTNITTATISKAVTSDDSAADISVTPSNPNSFLGVQKEEWRHGDLPKEKVMYIVIHDTNVYSMDITETLQEIDRLGVTSVPHFIVDRDGTIAQCVDLDSIARHAGTSRLDGANAKFGVTQERDDERDVDVSADYAMDAWSVGIAIVHDQDDGEYPNSQLNALDRLIAYIDEWLGAQPRIITQEDWEGVAIRLESKAEEELLASFSEEDSIDYDDGAIPAALVPPVAVPSDEERQVTALSSVSQSFPSKEYRETGNHGAVRTSQDAAEYRSSNGCDDAEPTASGKDSGDPIAEKAVEISGSAQENNPVAVAVSSSGADTTYPTDGGASRQLAYMSSSPKWKTIGKLRTGDAPSLACKPGDVLITEDGSHSMIYVGTKAAQKRYPSTGVNIFEDSQNTKVGKCYKIEAIESPSAYLIFRCVKSDDGDIIAESLKEAKRRIRNLPSETEYMCAVDYDRGVMHVFQGEKGNWEIIRSFRIRNGKNRLFGNEECRSASICGAWNTTPIGIFSLWSRKRSVESGGECALAVANTHAHRLENGHWLLTCNSFTHAYISPHVTPDVDYHTFGVDLVEQCLKRGRIHAGAGCITPMRDDAIWFYEDIVPAGDSTWYVWTEIPATEKDGFENETLRQIMVSKGYCDIAQLSASERAVTKLNTINFKKDWTWADVDAAYYGKGGGSDGDGSDGIDITKA